MKKRFLAVLLLAVLLAMSMAQAAWADDFSGQCGDDVSWRLNNGLLVISGTGPMTDFTEDALIANTPWQKYSSNIKNVVIEEGVTSIGSNAFIVCNQLSSVSLPSSMKTIGDFSFNHCSNLKSINIPNGVTTIGKEAFAHCFSLDEIVLPNSVVSVGETAFGWTALKNVVIPESLTVLEAHLFYACNDLISVKLPDGLENIGDGAFYGCANLKNINIPDGVKSIGEGAFYYCSNLQMVDIPDSVVNIGAGAFNMYNTATYLTSVKLPAGINIISERMFIDCQKLQEVNIPDNVTTIERQAFLRCKALNSLEIPEGLTTIESYAFDGCENLQDIYYAGSKEQWDKITIGSNNEPIINARIHFGKVTVPIESITLNQETVTLKMAETLTLQATVAPENATNKAVTWTTSDAKVATVSNGQVKAVGAGTATITVTTADGGKTAACTVTVTQPATGVTLNYSEISLLTGGTAQLQATVSEGASNKNVTWTSNNTTVATVDETGKVTAVSAGEAVITATAADGSGQKAECKVTVTGTAAPAEAIYTITFDTDGGTMAGPSVMQVTKETKVTMPTAEKSGYNFKYWQDVANSSQTYAANNVYSFAADTELKAIWERRSSGGSSGGGGSRPATKPGTTTETKPSTESNKPGNSGSKEITAANIGTVFGDVQNNAWYSEAIAYVYNKGMMNGTEKGFEPNSATTRAMIVTMLHRLNGTPAAGLAGFADVAGGQWYSEAVAWAAANGVVNGYSDTKFAPNEEITREQLAAILYRYTQFKGLDVSAKGDLSGFADGAAVSGWAQEAVQWAVGAGLLNGNADGTLAPAAGATRAEVAMILMRFEGAVK